MRAFCYYLTNNDLRVLGITMTSLADSSKIIFGTQAVTFCRGWAIFG